MWNTYGYSSLEILSFKPCTSIFIVVTSKCTFHNDSWCFRVLDKHIGPLCTTGNSSSALCPGKLALPGTIENPGKNDIKRVFVELR